MIFDRRWLICLTLAVLLISFATGAMAAQVDHSLIDMALEKFEELDAGTKDTAMSLLRSYFRSSGTLEVLKDDLIFILKTVLGDDYEVKLVEKGVSLSKMRSEIDKMKSWSSEDRLGILDLVDSGDTEGIAKILEKYEGADSGSHGGTGGASEETDVREEENGEGEAEGDETAVKFADIEDHWAASYIEFIASKGIIQGKAEGVFAPQDTVTRAEFTAMMSRLLKLQDDFHTQLPFDDVSEGDWFYDVVRSAFAQGIVRGKGDRFDPNSSITREEMVVLITRSVSLKKMSTPVDAAEIEALLSPFRDRGEISSWAETEVAIALKLGLISGKSAEALEPKADATRAEAATMIFNLYGVLESVL